MTTSPRTAPLDVLIIGTGVIGIVYGTWLALAGHRVSVLTRHPEPAGTRLLTIEDADQGTRQSANVTIASQAGATRWDLVVVAVQADDLGSTVGILISLAGAPSILVLGNNPLGRRALPPELPGTVILGFPGIGGVSIPSGPPAAAPRTSADLVRFVLVDQQPTTVGSWTGPAADAFFAALHHAGASTTRTDDMPGWLAHHTIFISCVSMALSKCENNAMSLALGSCSRRRHVSVDRGRIQIAESAAHRRDTAKPRDPASARPALDRRPLLGDALEIRPRRTLLRCPLPVGTR